MVITASVEYISASVNRFNRSSAASSSSLFVALWDSQSPIDRGVFATLPGHGGLVHVRLLSADDTGSMRLWRKLDSSVRTMVPSLSVQAHTKSISALCSHAQAGCIVTGSSDSLLKVWKLGEQDELQEVETVSMKGRYPLSLALAKLPQAHGGKSALILAVGSTDSRIHIFTRSENAFIPSATIPGHEDWVRAICLRPPTSSSEPLILASGSQDANIRLWNIEAVTRSALASSTSEVLSDDLLDAFEASLGEVDEGGEGGRQISLKKHILTVKTSGDSTQQFSITFDALLVGHEAGITSLAWRPSSTRYSGDTLLSTSADSSLILWSPVSVKSGVNGSSSALWVNQQRFGDVGGQRLGGFVGGLWTADGSEALAWGWSGGCRRWRCAETSEGFEGNEIWTEVGALTGHAGPVNGIAWSPGGEYLMSTGIDQTTRIHADLPANKDDKEPMSSWHEVSRPQVHGYDLLGVVSLGPLRFVSIADEKVARVFGAPRSFVNTIRGLGVVDLEVDEETLPMSASVPPLGLSNKATSDILPASTSAVRRPFEAELASITLWPEVEKVFGHGYEHAAVWIYETENFRPFGQPLEGHTLTVARIAFSPDDQLVLTVSRDRSWRLFRREESGYVPIAVDKSHTRIIWDGAWAADGKVFATASRDKTVKIWQPLDGNLTKWTAVADFKLSEAATAVAFAPPDASDERMLAVGLENGNILLFTSPNVVKWEMSLEIKPGLAHIDHIHQLAWRPGRQITEHRHIASCAEDGTLKIFAVHEGVN
ncbi:WD40-repeat-containing domain protein [Russula aff. rugulosa BPL654]|nr:WD40-repeat-containing domain protein [Russula aff. rugulosa BPL654]